MRKYLIAIAVTIALTLPAGAQLTPQQQRMKDCNAQASGISGEARKQFMSSCLSGATAARDSGTHSSQPLRWREMDSNFWSLDQSSWAMLRRTLWRDISVMFVFDAHLA
jgi:hypothetical protein